jgi:NAD(P)-dependent dehydrogenase (short-subunit alcohol dehydrogenase family)
MKDFGGRIAVVTGGGTGMGRELVRQLVAEGCHVAMCDIAEKTMAETIALSRADGVPQGVRITAHLADVSDEDQLRRFRDQVKRDHATEVVHLLFNNAGIGGAGSMIADAREAWERTFNICWGGVYLGVRTFLPMMLGADAGHIVNTSSINGAWASVGPWTPNTSYSAAKFAVRGFTEALIADLRLNAPHLKCSVVMPGHIGTEIVRNSPAILTGRTDGSMSAEALAQARNRLAASGVEVAGLSDAQIEGLMAERMRRFADEAPMTAAEAARVILAGVKADRWRILVGQDAERIDELLRERPEEAYEVSFYEQIVADTGWKLGDVRMAAAKK